MHAKEHLKLGNHDRDYYSVVVDHSRATEMFMLEMLLHDKTLNTRLTHYTMPQIFLNDICYEYFEQKS